MSWLVANPERSSGDISGSYSTAPPDAITQCKSAPYSEACGKYELTSWKPLKNSGKKK